MRNRVSSCALCLVADRRAGAGPDAASPVGRSQLVAPPAWAFNDLACAPALGPVKRDKKNEPPLRIVGVQDPAIRGLLGPGDTLVISGGSNAGLQPGQRFFVRRVIPAVSTTGPIPRATIHTSGWVQILGVDTMVSTATVVHACEGILFDDYLEPFVAPMIAARPLPGSTPQYDNMGHIMTGIEGLHTAGGRQCDDDRSRQQCRRRARPAVHGVQRQARRARRDTTGRSKAFAGDGAAMRRSSKSAKCSSSRCGRTMRPCRSSRRRDAITLGDLIAPIR